MLSLFVQKNNLGGLPKRRIIAIEKSISNVLKIKQDTRISVIFVTPMTIRKYNRLYRNKNAVTDVLSFSDLDENDDFPADKEDSFIGEMFICYDRAKKQAKEKKHSIQTELTLLTVHGVLHILGYDHEMDADYKKMNALENRIFKQIKAKKE